MKLNKEFRIAGAVVFLTLVILCSLINRNTNAVNHGNVLGEQQQYQRVLIACQTPASIESQDKYLRELCDKTLPKMRYELTH